MDKERLKEKFKSYIIKTNRKGNAITEQSLKKYTEGIIIKLKEILELSENPILKNLDYNIYSYKTPSSFKEFKTFIESDPAYDIVNRTGKSNPNWVKTPLNFYEKFLTDSALNKIKYSTEEAINKILKPEYKEYILKEHFGLRTSISDAYWPYKNINMNFWDIYRNENNVAKGLKLIEEYFNNNFSKTGKPYDKTTKNSYVSHMKELKRFFDTKYQGVDNFIEIKNIESEYNMENKNNIMNILEEFPLNLILYGPPGTGKTYGVRKYIYDLLGNNPGLNVEDEEQRINIIVKDLSWYTAIAISMYRNGKNNKYKVANLQHQKIIKAFALTRENKNLRAALWAQMQIHTSTDSKTVNYTNRQEPYIFEKTENSEWYLTEDGIKFVEENLVEQLELLDAKHSVRKIEDFYKFLTFHQSYSYEEFVEGIKPSINDECETSTIDYEYNKGIFKEICQQANSDPNNKYLLIIDEINRGNISNIFGELITLIESDKRVIPNGERTFEKTETKEEELTVTLPYTKSKFGVPNNLYILGTMNTSDRSIASIDIALRRRFKFKEMMPDSKLVADFGCGFKNIFESLNKKIKVLLDRDHQIGHSYFINTTYANANIDDLKEIWFGEIIPLLNEYFYCDWEKLKLVIPGFIKEIHDIPEYLKNECDDTAYEFKTPEDFSSDSDFETALKQEKY